MVKIYKAKEYLKGYQKVFYKTYGTYGILK